MKSLITVLLLPLSLLVITSSCTKHETPNPTIPEPGAIPVGMRLVNTNGIHFTMGANDSTTPSDERPAMQVSFTYNFYIDTTEVTQDEYFKLMDRKPVPTSSSYGVGGSFPVYYVSWFDAVLFCNEKSKKYGFDTVYTYNQVQTDSSGSVYNLVGLRINYSTEGYRLPTEAEWEFSAQSGSGNSKIIDTAGAWYSRNANGKTHIVASKAPNELGLYDMAGNVFEWTNDWKGQYFALSISNSIGAESPNREFERVLKGGAFLSDTKNLRPASRSTTYATTASSTTPYIGFRCAFGTVNPVSFVNNSTTAITTNPVDLVTASIANFTLSTNARLVFVNISGTSRTLCYVNYAQTHPQIYEFKDRDDVYTPTISPDGRFVAFSTADEGLRLVTSAKIFIRSLDSLNSPPSALPIPMGFVPRWWINPATMDTFLIYTNSAIDCDLTEWASTKTFMQKMSNGSPVGDPTIIVSNGSFHDGASADGHYIVTGQSKLKMKHMTDGEVKQLFVYPYNGKPSTGSTNVCNVSMCPDSAFTGICMFLDFGSNDISTLTNTSYGPHEYLFISRFSGETIKWMKCPANEKTWEYPEWSNQTNFAIAAAEDQNGNRKNIYLIKIKEDTDENHRLITGENLAHPYLWISQQATSQFDSSGRYDLPPKFSNQDMITAKMAGFWKWHDSMDIVFCGTSHTHDGIDPEMFKRKTFNLAIPATQMYENLSIINNYVLNHCKNVHLIGMDLILSRFFFPLPDSANSTLYSSNGYFFDKNHSFWKDSIPDKFTKSLNSLPLPDFTSYITKGLQIPAKGWGDPTVENTKTVSINSPEYDYNFGELKKTADTLRNHQIHFLLVITPENPGYSTTPYYAHEGPEKEVARSVIAQIRDLEKSNPYVHLYDAHLEGNHDYTDADAQNTDHLCGVGAKKLSKRLDSLVTVILK